VDDPPATLARKVRNHNNHKLNIHLTRTYLISILTYLSTRGHLNFANDHPIDHHRVLFGSALSAFQ